jgi:hypothetical protein
MGHRGAKGSESVFDSVPLNRGSGQTDGEQAAMTETISKQVEASPAEPVEERARLVGQLDSRPVAVLTVLGFAIPAVGYFWVVAHFGVNVIVADQLTNVSVIKASQSHLIPWGALWVQHNQNRMLFPNLLVLVLGRTVHFDIRIEELLGAVLVLCATALFIWSHKRRSPETPWIYYCPVAFLTFSLVQYENTLWGFQVAWYMVLVSLAVAIVLLDRRLLTWWALGGAVVAGIVGSYSSFEGLFIWPVGLLLLYQRRRRLTELAVWGASAITTAAVFFYRFSSTAEDPSHGYALHHLWASAKLFVFAMGDIVGVSVKPGAGNTNVLIFGVLVLILAVFTLVYYGARRDESSGGPIGVALVFFGLLFAASVTQGRVLFGYWGAAASRYTTFDLMTLVGIYLAVLGSPARRMRSPASEGPEATIESAPVGGGTPVRIGAPPVLLAVRGAVALVVTIQILLGLQNGVPAVRATQRGQLAALRVSENLSRSSDNYLRYFVARWDSGPYIRAQLKEAEQLHLSLYSGSAGRP